MPSRPLHTLPAGSNVFMDANIFIYGLTGASPQCLELLERCSREDLDFERAQGIVLYRPDDIP